MKPPRFASLLLFAVCNGPVFAAAVPEPEQTPETSGFAPKEYSLSRYDHLNKKSPFEFDPQKPAETSAVDPFEGVSLAGYVGSGDTMTVYLLTGKEKQRVAVYGDGSPYKKRDESGFRVAGIKRGKTLKSTAVILEKDGQKKEIMFEEDALRSKGGGASPGVQMVPGPDGKMVPRPVIPRPGGAAAPQNNTGYQAPQAFIPGQAAPQPPQPQAGVAVTNNAPPQIPQPGQPNPAAQQVNAMLNNPAPVQPGQTAVPQAVQAGHSRGGENNIRNGVPPTRRRVVLPTQ